jgi:hypothetical protein
LVERAFNRAGDADNLIELDMLKRLAGEESLNMTRLALNLSEYVNGVAERHAEVSRKMFPGYRVHAITNGVHPFTWVAPGFRRLYDQYLPGWSHEPEMLMRADDCIADAAIWNAHGEVKQALIGKVKELTGVGLSTKLPILGFARRMTAYKRPELLFTDLARLRSIALKQPLQIVLAGKAHPRDEQGKDLIEKLHGYMRSLAPAIPIVFLPNYDMDLARILVAGADVWLNTPLPPMEASGTSGMKAAFNGVPNLSILDGWWIEGCIEGVTGWSIEESGEGAAQSLYGKLENTVLPLYYNEAANPRGWMHIMKGAISKNASYFNSHWDRLKEHPLARVGPGLITGVADDDPSGIATYSQAGAQFGLNMLWTMPLAFPLMAAIQSMCALDRPGHREGTRRQHQDRVPARANQGVVLLLLIANTLNIAADVAAMGEVGELVTGFNRHLMTVFFVFRNAAAAGFSSPIIATCFFLKWLTLSLLAYAAVLFTVHVPWGEVALRTVWPRLHAESDAAAVVVGVFGTTISPYLFFWQASEEVEDMQVNHAPRRWCAMRRGGSGTAPHSLGHLERHVLLRHRRLLHHSGDRRHAARGGNHRHRYGGAGGQRASAAGGRTSPTSSLRWAFSASA